MKKGDSGKAYHVKKAQKRKKKTDKEIRKMVARMLRPLSIRSKTE